MENPQVVELSQSNFQTSEEREELFKFVEQIEKWEGEKTRIMEEIRESLRDAKQKGFDLKALREILKLRKMKDSDRKEQEAILDTYKMIMGLE